MKWTSNGLYRAFSYIKNNVDILDYLTSHEGLAFKKYGSTLRCVCPLHADKDPSFTVSKDKGIYFCFGCKSGGGIVNYVEEKHNINRVQAIRHIFQAIGKDINEYVDEEQQSSHIYDKAMEYFLQQTDNRLYVDFFEKKVFGLEVAKKHVGFSLSADGLKDFLVSAGFSEQDVWNYDLCGEKLNCSIVYPVRDLSGCINHFNFRTFTETKYIKTNDNVFGFIPQLPYGVDKLIPGQEVVFVEGQNDYYALMDKCNVLGMMGTKFSQDMVELLLAYDINTITFWVDGDAGGWNFLKSLYDKYAEIFCKNNIIAYAVFVKGKDPDDIADYDYMSGRLFLPEIILNENKMKDSSIINYALKKAKGYNTITLEMLFDYLVIRTKTEKLNLYDIYYDLYSQQELCDEELERKLLSLLIADPKLLHEHAITEEVFMFKACRQVVKLLHEGHDVDIIKAKVPEWIKNFISDLPIGKFVVSSLVEHLKELANIRKLKEIAKSVIVSNDSSEESVQKLNDALVQFYKGADHEFATLGGSFKEVINNILSDTTETGISFGAGWASFDRILFGLCNHRLIMLTGSTGHGKTTIALNWAYNMSVIANHKGLYFSGEMPAREITQRFISMGTGIDHVQIQTAKCNDREMNKIYDLAAKINGGNLIMDGTMEFDKLISIIKYAKIKHNIEYVIIDYLQLLEPPKRMNSLPRTQQLKEMSRILKSQICEELDLPVVFLSQLADAALDDATPTARRNSESKLVQADCDVTIAMRKKTDKEIELDPIGNVLCFIDKVRYNSSGILIPLEFVPNICFIKESNRS